MRSLSRDPVLVSIIGAARSGTKLLRDSLAQMLSTARVPYDINYIWRMGNEQAQHDELDIDDLTPRAAARIRRHLLRKAHGRWLIEKTVSNTLRVPYVRAVWPGVRFVHLTRDGLDVIESSYRQWQLPADWRYSLRKAASYPWLSAPGYGVVRVARSLTRSGSRTQVWGPEYNGIHQDVKTRPLLEVCAIQWRRSVETAAADLSTLPRDEWISLRYEDLVRDPERTLGAIAEFLGSTPAHRGSVNPRAFVAHGRGRTALDEQAIALITPHVDAAERALQLYLGDRIAR